MSDNTLNGKKVYTREYFQKWGAIGGSKSRRTLSKEKAREMGIKRALKYGETLKNPRKQRAKPSKK